MSTLYVGTERRSEPRLMPAENEVTLGELWRNFQALSIRLENSLKDVNNSIRSLNYVSQDRYNAERAADQARISELEDKIRWITRTVSAALVTALVSVVLTYFAVRAGT